MRSPPTKREHERPDKVETVQYQTTTVHQKQPFETPPEPWWLKVGSRGDDELSADPQA